MASHVRFFLAALVLTFVVVSAFVQALLSPAALPPMQPMATLADGADFKVKPQHSARAYLRSSYDYRCGRALTACQAVAYPAASTPTIVMAWLPERERSGQAQRIQDSNGRAFFRSRAPPIG